MTARTMFRTGFSAERWFGMGQQFVPASNLIQPGQSVGLTTVNVPRSRIEDGNGALLRTLAVPPGWTATYPYVVKVGNVGEYIMYADKTAQYIDYGTGRVWPPVSIG